MATKSEIRPNAANGIATLIAKSAAALAAMAMLTGCGSSLLNFNVGPVTPDGATTSSSSSSSASGTNAECNLFSMTTGATLNGRLTTYYYNGVLQNDRARMRITGIDAQFINNGNVNVEMFRWKADSTGNVTLDPTPLSFEFEQGTGSTTPFSNTMSALSLSTVAQLNAMGLGATTVQGFFADTTLVVLGLDSSWQGLRIVMSNGLLEIGQVDMLIPMFTANPNEYATTHSQVLSALHPFWAQRTQNQTDAYWTNLSESYCF